jgi:ribose-phosphate pyrophosphokinase
MRRFESFHPSLQKRQNVEKKESGTILVAGTSHPALFEKVAWEAKTTLFPMKVLHFPDGELRIQIGREVAGRDAVILETLAHRPNDFIIETMLIADALRRAGARRIILACPYLAYSRQNLPEHDGASLAARLFAFFLHEVGISELITLDLHAEHIPSFYDFPVQHLSARKCLADAFKKENRGIVPVVVGPDLGSAKLVASYAEEFQSSFALIQKRRLDARNVQILSLVGEVNEKDVLLADDMCSTASTMVSAAQICREKGAKRIFACATHGLFVEHAIEQIEQSPIERFYVTDSVDNVEALKSSKKIRVVSCASLLAGRIGAIAS